MKKHFVRSALSLGIFLMVAHAASAQHYVRVQPQRPPMAARPPAPAPGQVWISEEWKWANGRYVWSGGYWARPPYRGAIWIPGRWRRTKYGMQWVPGHWRRR